ncbi:phospholipase, patatin family protein [Xylogone sp. PMI_703]|nr:phospholipase, patatin family protein [Xylogone sp. PMI_703]
MERVYSQSQSSSSNQLDESGLCLLSLDGGGVRGLSTLYILKSLMDQLNYKRQRNSLPTVKPCEIFDLMGGSGAGGLIAIMLGRLEMDVDECIMAYRTSMKTVFKKRSRRWLVNRKGQIKARFDSGRLKVVIESVIESKGLSKTSLFNDGSQRGCKVFVCAATKELYSINRIRSYDLPDELGFNATISEAALATSAVTSFFDPVWIDEIQFVGGILGANNPVDEVEGEAANIWCPQTADLKPLVKCFISIGAGRVDTVIVEDTLVRLLKTMVHLATETEETERKFIARWRKHYDDKRYFRFNVERGMRQVGFVEYEKQDKIKAATYNYLSHQVRKDMIRDCTENLRLKQSLYVEKPPR